MGAFRIKLLVVIQLVEQITSIIVLVLREMHIIRIMYCEYVIVIITSSCYCRIVKERPHRISKAVLQTAVEVQFYTKHIELILEWGMFLWFLIIMCVYSEL